MSDARSTAGRRGSHSVSQPSRREFLKLSALGALTVVGAPAMAGPLTGPVSRPAALGRGNSMPGRIVVCHDPAMGGHIPTVNKERVEEVVHQAVRLLTESEETGAAFEALFPGVHSGSIFAIKVNCLGPTCTRWEVARGVVSGLSRMLGGTYDVSQVTLYDRHDLAYYGYDESEFTFNGHTPLISHTNDADGSGYEPVQGHELSRYILDCDYLINLPVLKSHSEAYNQITVALKCHYGSCHPSNLCADWPPTMLPLNADPQIKDKTCLVLMDGLRGTYYGGPSDPPQTWDLYPELTPNTLLVTTDPVTNEYWARDFINAQRVDDGYAPKPCTWIEEASGEPYNLGISDPDEMTVINLNALAVDDGRAGVARPIHLAAVAPNPMSSDTTLRFRLEEPARATILIVGASGRAVRRLGDRSFPAGESAVRWDGRDARGRRVAAGVYFARLKVGDHVHTRRLVVAP